jgi:hypothetical protein
MKLASLSILITVLMIPILALLSYQQFKSAFSAETDLGASRTDLPKLDKAVENLRIGENTSYLDFSDPYGKLKITYGSSWIKTDENTIEETKKLAQSDKEELLLFLYKVDLASLQPSYLAVERIKMGNWDSIMGSMQQDAEANNQTMEIVKSSLTDSRISLEIKYAPKTAQKTKSGGPTHQREEILLNGDESYVVTIITTERNWPLVQPEAEEIIRSIEFLGTPLKTILDDQNANANVNGADNINNALPAKTPAPEPKN